MMVMKEQLWVDGLMYPSVLGHTSNSINELNKNIQWFIMNTLVELLMYLRYCTFALYSALNIYLNEECTERKIICEWMGLLVIWNHFENNATNVTTGSITGYKYPTNGLVKLQATNCYTRIVQSITCIIERFKTYINIQIHTQPE